MYFNNTDTRKSFQSYAATQPMDLNLLVVLAVLRDELDDILQGHVVPVL